jgi:hypothetical protein
MITSEQIEFSLESLVEALLIDFISDSINWNLERGKREFKKTIFSDIRNFKRLLGANEKFRHVENIYHTDDYQEAHIIQRIDNCRTDDEYWKFSIILDTSFGGFEFECTEICVTSKIGRGEKVDNNQWVYYDVATNEIFEFSNPFLDRLTD